METRGDILIWSLCEIYSDAIIYVIFEYSDVCTYRKEPMVNILTQWIGGIRKIGINRVSTATSKGNIFLHFFFSVDGILGKEAPCLTHKF